jgi:hypothetical protein
LRVRWDRSVAVFVSAQVELWQVARTKLLVVDSAQQRLRKELSPEWKDTFSFSVSFIKMRNDEMRLTNEALKRGSSKCGTHRNTPWEDPLPLRRTGGGNAKGPTGIRDL